jgi:hypothetical protein
VPASELRRLGVRAIDRRRYELADGAVREYEIGLARVELLDGMTAGRIIFGPEDAEPCSAWQCSSRSASRSTR